MRKKFTLMVLHFRINFYTLSSSFFPHFKDFPEPRRRCWNRLFEMIAVFIFTQKSAQMCANKTKDKY